MTSRLIASLDGVGIHFSRFRVTRIGFNAAASAAEHVLSRPRVSS
jgi:hypothetical protein